MLPSPLYMTDGSVYDRYTAHYSLLKESRHRIQTAMVDN